MNFLHLSTGDARGAFAGAYRLHRNLLASGHQSVMLVADKKTADSTVIAPTRAVQATGRFLVRAANQILKLVSGRHSQVAHHLAINHPLVTARGLIRQLDGFRPDLVVVHYTSGFISPDALREVRLMLGVPMALYLMDMEMLTGGCHYAWQCKGYLNQCEECPVPRSRMVKFLIRRQWMQRRRSYLAAAPFIVPASGWLERQATAARLTADLSRRKILIGIDPEQYKPRAKAALRKEFRLPGHALVFYFGAQNLDDPRKGFRHLREALHALPGLLSATERESIVLFTVGKLDRQALGDLPFAHVHQPYISDPDLFAATYAAADLFICPSVEDSGPMMINESIVSGTPVAAFEMGVAVDLVHDGSTGFRVPLGDGAALASALARFVRLDIKERSAMSLQCRKSGMELCSAESQVRAFVALAAQTRQLGERNPP